MGKQTNTTQILQVGKKNNKYIWDSKYFEKHSREVNTYLFQSIEIKKFLTIFLKTYGLSLYKYNINFSESELKLFISYFKTSKIKNIIPEINKNDKFKLVKKKTNLKKYLYKNFIVRQNKKKSLEKKTFLKKFALIKFYNFFKLYLKQKFFLEKKIKTQFKSILYTYKLKQIAEKHKFLTKLKFILLKKHVDDFQYFNKVKINLALKNKLNTFYHNYVQKQIIKSYINIIKLKKLLSEKYQNYFKFFLIKYNNYNNLFKTYLLNKKLYKKRLKILRDYKNYVKLRDNKISQNLKSNNFLKKCVESLNAFTKNKVNNVLILQQVNQNIIFNLTYRQLQLLKKLVIQLRQFKNSSFFKEGLNVILSSLINPNSSELLVNFIATQLQLTKRHGFLFKFLRKTLFLLIKHKISKVKSIKILIKGRINKKPRSKHKLIFINKYMSLMTISSSINFTQSTAYSPNGTLGVKLWVNTN